MYCTPSCFHLPEIDMKNTENLPKEAKKQSGLNGFVAFLSGKRCASDSFGSGVHIIGQQVDTAPCGAASRSRLVDMVGGPGWHYG